MTSFKSQPIPQPPDNLQQSPGECLQCPCTISVTAGGLHLSLCSSKLLLFQPEGLCAGCTRPVGKSKPLAQLPNRRKFLPGRLWAFPIEKHVSVLGFTVSEEGDDQKPILSWCASANPTVASARNLPWGPADAPGVYGGAGGGLWTPALPLRLQHLRRLCQASSRSIWALRARTVPRQRPRST